MDLVVHEHVATVIGAIFVRGVYVVRVARVVLQAAIGLGAHDFFRFVGDAPPNEAIHVEDRNALEQTARGQAINAAFARVAAGPDAIIGVEFARCHVELQVAAGGGGFGRGCGGGTGGRGNGCG